MVSDFFSCLFFQEWDGWIGDGDEMNIGQVVGLG